MDLAELAHLQRVSLWLDERSGLGSVPEALGFLAEVSLALRYGAASNLPLASMYRATQRQVPVPEDERAAHARAFELTNGVLASGKTVEINLIGGRLALAHERLMPAIYALRRGSSGPRISDTAREALEFIVASETATSGDIRRLLKAEGQPRPDAADLALTELQQELLVDRGPSSGPSTGVFYLSREGYPYRAFAPSHPWIVSTALALSRPEAAAELLRMYLDGALFAMRRKLVSLFQLLLSADELDDAVRNLTGRGAIELQRFGKTEVILNARVLASESRLKDVQEISIVTSRLPTVYRAEGSRTVFLTFEGLRESHTASDKLTRLRIAMPAAELPRLQELLLQSA